jgi:two-component system sensor histidine kinase HydH
VALSARRAPARPRPPLASLLDALVTGSDAGVLVIDPFGVVTAVNPAALRMLGIGAPRARGARASDLLRTVVPGDDPMRDAFRGARTERDVMLLTEGGVELTVQLRSVRMGRPPWVLVTLQDLTQMRRLQQELRRNERLATLGQLSAGVAHEIRNPLAGIGTSAQVLLRRFEPRDERARFVEVILEEVARLDRIVTSLLQYARPRAPELKPARLEGCIERALQLCEQAIAQAGIRVEREASPRLAPVWIDEDLMTQVLLNVTLNAIQAMANGGRLRYELRRIRRRSPSRGPGRRASDGNGTRPRRTAVPPWREELQIRVIDTGPGIPRGLLPKLFDPFFSTKPRGTGLGLSISQTIMHEHGGTIAVASREGRGTTVLLNLPVEKRHGERRRSGPNAGRTRPAHRG